MAIDWGSTTENKFMGAGAEGGDPIYEQVQTPLDSLSSYYGPSSQMYGIPGAFDTSKAVKDYLTNIVGQAGLSDYNFGTDALAGRAVADAASGGKGWQAGASPTTIINAMLQNDPTLSKYMIDPNSAQAQKWLQGGNANEDMAQKINQQSQSNDSFGNFALNAAEWLGPIMAGAYGIGSLAGGAGEAAGMADMGPMGADSYATAGGAGAGASWTAGADGIGGGSFDAAITPEVAGTTQYAAGAAPYTGGLQLTGTSGLGLQATPGAVGAFDSGIGIDGLTVPGATGLAGITNAGATAAEIGTGGSILGGTTASGAAGSTSSGLSNLIPQGLQDFAKTLGITPAQMIGLGAGGLNALITSIRGPQKINNGLTDQQIAQQAVFNHPGTGSYGHAAVAPLGRTYVPYTGDPLKYGMSGGEHQFFDNVNPQQGAQPAMAMHARGGLERGHPHGHMMSPLDMLHDSSTNQDMVRGPGGGQDDMVPARLSPGEYVLDADTMANLGDGNPEEGARRMDGFRERIRAHKRSGPLSSIPPKAKMPEAYLRKAA